MGIIGLEVEEGMRSRTFSPEHWLKLEASDNSHFGGVDGWRWTESIEEEGGRRGW